MFMSLIGFPLLFALSPIFLSRNSLASVAYCGNKRYEYGAMGISPFQTYSAAPYSPVQINYALPPVDCPTNSQVHGYFFFSAEGPAEMDNYGLIMKPDGTLVFATPGFMRGLQKYKGIDHIAVWIGEGSPVVGGHGSGYHLLIDDTYTVVTNFTTVNLGVGADNHELQITPNDTAVMTAYPTQAADLTAYGGPEDGYVLNCAVQEVDITTGEALFTWQVLDHVDPSECYVPIAAGDAGVGTLANPWDYFHINSVQKFDNGNYLISSRHCHTLYLVNPVGNIIWRMGGPKSDFTFGQGANFSWQHHARIHNSSTLSLFNNGASGWDQDFPYSQGLLLNYDENERAVTLINARSPFNRTVTTAQGSHQLLDNGEAIVGWGTMPYFSQHDTNGRILWSAQIAPSNNAISSYRVFLHNWTGRPASPPSINFANSSASTTVTVYAWWNGATEVVAWQLFGSTASEPLNVNALHVVRRVDFETRLSYRGTGEREYVFFQVAALNGNGEYLGYSDLVSVNGSVTLSKTDIQTATVAPL